MTTKTEFRERPIIFSGPMVRAILEGRKTQTRRVVTRREKDEVGGWVTVSPARGYTPETVAAQYGCPYGQPGDLLYVRETWAEVEWSDGAGYEGTHVLYKADREEWSRTVWRPDAGDRWRPSIHMPKSLTRLWLRVTDVRVERVQEISRGDAIAEGIERVGGDMSCTPWKNYALAPGEPFAKNCASPVRSFQTLWDSINAKRGHPWESNPWVWRVSFEREDS